MNDDVKCNQYLNRNNFQLRIKHFNFNIVFLCTRSSIKPFFFNKCYKRKVCVHVECVWSSTSTFSVAYTCLDDFDTANQRVCILSLHCREDVFTVTCGRSGVGNITSIDLRIDGRDGWVVSWVRIANGIETFVIKCDDTELDSDDTRRFNRDTPD